MTEVKKRTVDFWEQNQYVPLVKKILEKGERRSTRNQDTLAIFGEKLVIDMEHNFPLLTGRKIHYKPVIGELAAMLNGPKHVNDFKSQGCNYWDKFADEQGNLNLDYGNAWKDFNGYNQLKTLVETIVTDPTNRRLLVTGWNPANIDKLTLPCCHMLYQWYVRDGKYLDMIWYQRSVDVMIGLPSDIVLAATWNTILANQTNLQPGKLTFMLGDTHIYTNHLLPTIEYLRAPKPINNATCSIVLGTTVDDFKVTDIIINGYDITNNIKFELNV
jgi:thymidylate synthase